MAHLITTTGNLFSTGSVAIAIGAAVGGVCCILFAIIAFVLYRTKKGKRTKIIGVRLENVSENSVDGHSTGELKNHGEHSQIADSASISGWFLRVILFLLETGTFFPNKNFSPT